MWNHLPANYPDLVWHKNKAGIYYGWRGFYIGVVARYIN